MKALKGLKVIPRKGASILNAARAPPSPTGSSTWNFNSLEIQPVDI